MNAPMSIKTDAAETLDFRAHYTAVNEWRGRCIVHFCKAERAVTQTLVSMQRSGKLSTTINQLVGKRFGALAEGLREDAAKPARNALEKVQNFQKYDELRACLCHGVIDLSLCPDGQWQVIINVAGFSRGNLDPTQLIVKANQAKATEKTLGKLAQQLDGVLKNLRNTLEVDNTAKPIVRCIELPT